MDVLSIGMALCDIIARPVARDFLSSEATLLESISLSCGGDAANVAVNTTALGMRSALVSAVGRDEMGEMLRRRLTAAGVDCSYVRCVEGSPTGAAIVLIDDAGEHRFLASLGMMRAIEPDFVSDTMLDNARVLFFGSAFRLPALDDGGIAPVFKRAREKGVITAMDTTRNKSSRPAFGRLAETLAYTDLFLPSYGEAVEITGETDVRKMRDIMARFPIRLFAVKLGGKGCYITDFREDCFVSPFPVGRVIDTTGAGDSFVSGILYAQLAGKSMIESALFANAVAAFNIGQVGATGGVPPASSVEAFIGANRGAVTVT